MRTPLLCLALLGISLQAHAEELTAEKRADIRRMMEASGSARLSSQLTKVAQLSFRQSLQKCSNCSPKTFETIDREIETLFSVRAKEKGGLNDRMIEVYHKHFSHAEVRELMVFYSSPLGKRMLTVSPLIAQESMSIGQQWGMGLREELQKNVRAALAKEKLPYPAVEGPAPQPGQAPLLPAAPAKP